MRMCAHFVLAYMCIPSYDCKSGPFKLKSTSIQLLLLRKNTAFLPLLKMEKIHDQALYSML